MNISFIIVGLTQLFGALLLHRSGILTSKIGTIGMVLAGFGTIIVGIFPENAPGPWHAIGAALPFLLGNSAIALIAISSQLPRVLMWYGVATTAVTLIALVCFMLQLYGPLGIGGVERIVAYPQTIWLIVMGIFFIRHRSGIATRS